jgi:transposase
MHSSQGTTEHSSTAPVDLIAALQLRDRTIADLAAQVDALKHQLDWFKRQMFGNKSERFIANPAQMSLGEIVPLPDKPLEPPTRIVPAHTRRVAQADAAKDSESLPFFDESRVPIQTITLAAPEQAALSADQYEVISEKVSFRLAQRPGSYVVLKYVRPVIKVLESKQLHCAPAPAGVIDGSRADVSFVAGVMVEKCAYHLPLYRQHQKTTDCGFNLSRPWFTQIIQKGIGLVEPIYDAQLQSIRMSRVKAMDETPIKAGRIAGYDHQPGKMKGGYYWPVYGEQDEVCFPFFPTREKKCVSEVLGLTQSDTNVLLSDGYAAYNAYANKTGITHARCWAHARREFFEAQAADPTGTQQALEQIKALYEIEAHLRDKNIKAENKRLHRLLHSKPLVDVFFAWIDEQFKRHGLLPNNPFTKALAYARSARMGLEVFLTDPDVPMDTNHLERALRVIPMGRKNWNFCWTEMGAQHIGIAQSLIVTCRLHSIDPYTYLVDVLQRVSQHPSTQVAELTPRMWKQLFADSPLRSDLDRLKE